MPSYNFSCRYVSAAVSRQGIHVLKFLGDHGRCWSSCGWAIDVYILCGWKYASNQGRLHGRKFTCTQCGSANRQIRRHLGDSPEQVCSFSEEDTIDFCRSLHEKKNSTIVDLLVETWRPDTSLRVNTNPGASCWKETKEGLALLPVKNMKCEIPTFVRREYRGENAHATLLRWKKRLQTTTLKETC